MVKEVSSTARENVSKADLKHKVGDIVLLKGDLEQKTELVLMQQIGVN